MVILFPIIPTILVDVRQTPSNQNTVSALTVSDVLIAEALKQYVDTIQSSFVSSLMDWFDIKSMI